MRSVLRTVASARIRPIRRAAAANGRASDRALDLTLLMTTPHRVAVREPVYLEQSTKSVQSEFAVPSELQSLA